MILVYIRQPLDLEAMQDAIKLFIGKHDFSSFRAHGCQANKPLRTIDEASIDIKGKKLFLYSRHSPSFINRLE